MYGNEPGDERRQGAMNQHIVSRLLTRKMAYWVLHTQGESAVSVLISALDKAAKQKKLNAAEGVQWVMDQVSTVEDAKPYLTKDTFDETKEISLIAWGTTTVTTLEAVATAATGSCVLGCCTIGGYDE